MKLPIRLSILCFIALLVVGSTALGYYYYYVYSPPLTAATLFMEAMESGDPAQLEPTIIMSVGLDSGNLRLATDKEISELLRPTFERGRVLDQRKRKGNHRAYHYLVYRQPDGQVYALVVTEFEGEFRIVIPESQMSESYQYLWDYTWMN